MTAPIATSATVMVTVTATTTSVAMDMVHSEEEIRHALTHLIGDSLRGNETMVIYRNVRKKYAAEDETVREGIRSEGTFRTPEEGVVAAYRAGISESGASRRASALYVTINPRDVAEGLKTTHSLYHKWLEGKAGMTKDQVRKGDRDDFAGTLDKAFRMNVLKSESRHIFEMIDVDDKDPETWLKQVRDAIADENIEMIVETKNGYHVVYNSKSMPRANHAKLAQVLKGSPKGKDEKATKSKGPSIQCALPGGMQSDHKTRILYCSCSRRRKEADERITHSTSGEDS